MVLTTLEFFFISIPIIMVFLYRRRREHPIRVLFLALFTIYVYLALHVTLFPIDFSEIKFNPHMWLSINLDPFKYHLPTNIYLNILLTVPLGLLYPFLWRHSWFKTLFISILSGLIIETAQLVIGSFTKNYTRIVDTADLLYNLIGVLVGYVIFRIIKSLLAALLKSGSFRKGSFAHYFFDIKGE